MLNKVLSVRLKTKPHPISDGEGAVGAVVVCLGSHALAVAEEVMLQVVNDKGVLL